MEIETPGGDGNTGNTKLKYMKKTNSEHHCQLNPLFSVDENGKVVAVILPVFIANSLQEREVS